MTVAVRTVDPPPDGIWRVGHATDPFKSRLSVEEALTAQDLNDPRVGNRFDSPIPGLYGVIYFGTQLECCFAETLSRLRPDPRLFRFTDQDQDDGGLMMPGSVPADWRHRRLAIRASVEGPFLDVEALESRVAMEPDLRLILSAYGYEELDIPAIMTSDRRVTRWISQWAWSREDDHGVPVFAGIRYLSRLNLEWECWAVFDRSPIVEFERQQIKLEMDALRHICELYNLQVF